MILKDPLKMITQALCTMSAITYKITMQQFNGSILLNSSSSKFVRKRG